MLLQRKISKLISREEELLEQGLARARASIRKAGTSSVIVSSIAGVNRSDVDRVVVYRNRAAFYR